MTLKVSLLQIIFFVRSSNSSLPVILERVSNGKGGGVGGQCVLLKPKIFIPIPTGKVFIGIIRSMKQTFIAVNRTK